MFQEFLDKGKLQQGLHTLRVGFPGKQFSEPLKIEFYIESPIVEATLENVPGTPYNKLLTGEALSKRQDPQEWLKIDLFFHHEGEPIHISLPVTRVIDEQTKRVHFSFQAPIENIPHIPQDDQRYGAPFFAFQVTDEAGNKYYNVLSYAQFVAPGKNHFGVGSVADFLVQKFKGEKDSNTVMDFQLVPTASSAKRFYEGQPALTLKVNASAKNINKLQWTHLPDEIRPTQPLTLIYRNDQQLTISFGNTFTDGNVPQDQHINYQVAQASRDGTLYESNIVESPFPPHDSSLDVSTIAKKNRNMALVIGNARYESSPLRNPANDALDIASVLRGMGFDVDLRIDIKHQEMAVAIDTFVKKSSREKGAKLFYFAGHAISISGEDFVIPIDAKISKEQDVKYRSIPVRDIMDKLLDVIDTKSAFIAYATSPGSVAGDGTGRNGVFTEEILKEIRHHGIEIHQLFKKVRDSVRQKTNGKQVPWFNSSTTHDFYFSPS